MAELHLGKYSIYSLTNQPVASKCYVIIKGRECIIVDPGMQNIEILTDLLSKYGVEPVYIILTHEHYDHCMGVDKLRGVYVHAKLIASYNCNKNIQDDRMNLSRYADEDGKGFTVQPADIVIDSDSGLILLGLSFRFLLTPGHSQGSMCFDFDANLFSGDVLIPDCKPVLRLKGSSVADFHHSMEMLKAIYGDSKLNLHPGHGEKIINYCFER